jgi:hypothetical protein
MVFVPSRTTTKVTHHHVQKKRHTEFLERLEVTLQQMPVVGAAVAEAVSIPVLGGFGGGPWLDGRTQMAYAAIGYAASAIDDPPDTYANVAQISLEPLTAYAEDVCAGRQIKGGLRA